MDNTHGSLLKPRMHCTLDHGQIWAGIGALLLGASVYVLDRPVYEVYFLHETFAFSGETPLTFGPVGDHLPTFLHVMAFGLITSGFLASERRGAFAACMAWLLVNVVFELGQHGAINSVISGWLPSWFANVPVLEVTAEYFSRGTFDWLDLLSMGLGALLAYRLCLILQKKKKRRPS